TQVKGIGTCELLPEPASRPNRPCARKNLARRTGTHDIGAAPLESPMNPIPSEPVHLMEDAETGDHILLYGTEKGTRLELRYEGDTLWMNQPQIADLFGVSRQSVNAHLINIYED